jgi:hypothetical protein
MNKKHIDRDNIPTEAINVLVGFEWESVKRFLRYEDNDIDIDRLGALAAVGAWLEGVSPERWLSEMSFTVERHLPPETVKDALDSLAELKPRERETA